MKKILILIESLSGGGAEKVLSTMLQHIDHSKFDITLCCICDTGKYIETVKQHVHYTYIIPNPNGLRGWRKLLFKLKYKLIYNWLPLKWVYKWFVPKNADIEIAYVEGFATKLLSHSTNKTSKKIAWVHIDLEKFHWTKNIYKNIDEEEKTYQKYNQLVTVSQTSRESFKRKFKNAMTPIMTLYNPIDSNEIISKSNQIIEYSASNRSDKIRLVSTGRFTPQKAYDRLLRIISKLIQENYAIELWLLGDGEQRNLLESIIKELHLENVVTLLGFQSNPYAYLSKCDLFVCSSISEGYSTAVTEALILGLPVITTDCSGMHELLKNGECGIITENSEEALYKGLKQLLDNPTTIIELKKKAELRGQEFSLENLISPIELLLLE